MMALSIQNSCSSGKEWKDREELYLQTIRKYKGKEQKFVEMTAHLAMTLEDEICDALGEIYMASGCWSKHTGQFFTPFHVSEMCAAISLEPDADGIYRVYEPTCGGGAMILAAAKVLKDRGVNYHQCLKVIAQDLDWNSVYMCYVQASMCGIDAVVAQGDTLQGPGDHILMTPVHMGI